MDLDLYFEIITYVLAGLFGLCVGSFLNVVIYRVPNGMSIAMPPSHCTSCDYVLKWYDNIPVISYIMLGGKCRKCKSRISFRYTAVEIANMLLWLLCVWVFWEKSIVMAIVAALASSLFICVFFIDLEHKLVFDRFVIMICALGLVAAFADPFYGWASHFVGGIVGFGSFFVIGFAHYLIRKREGLGGGDVKLAGAAGLLLGWERFIFSVVIAAVIASVVLLILSRVKKSADGEEDDGEYPFAPFLTFGFAVSMFFGYHIITAYLSLLGV